MLQKVRSIIADDNQLDSETLRFLSLIFLFLSGIMSLFTYTRTNFFGMDSDLIFQPSFISSILGIALISPLYIRGILKWNKSIYSIISFTLILMVFSSFLELVLGANDKSSFIMALVGASIVLSWLGIRAAAGVSWMLVLAAAIASVIVNNYTMGFFGFIYVASGALGLILHSGLNPGEFVHALRIEYSGNSEKIINNMRDDIGSINHNNETNPLIELTPKFVGSTNE